MCDGSHLVRECLNKASFHAMMAEMEEGLCEKEDAQMGSLRVLNAINARRETPKVEAKGKERMEPPKIEVKGKTRVKTPKVEAKGKMSMRAPKVEAKGNEETKSKVEAKGLQYMNTIVNKIPTRALVDTGETQNFVSGDKAKRLGLKKMEESGWREAASGDAKPISGVA